MLSTNVIVGTRLPTHCSSPDLAILSRLPVAEAQAVLERSDCKPLMPATTWQMPQLLEKLELCARRGYPHAYEEIFPGDISLAAAVLKGRDAPAAAISISLPKIRCPATKAEARYAPLVMSAAQAMSSNQV